MSENKTVLVTGASSGLGAQFCRALSAQGFTVIAAARRLEKLKALCAEIHNTGGKAHALALDVTDLNSFASAIDEAEKMAGLLLLLGESALQLSNRKFLQFVLLL